MNESPLTESTATLDSAPSASPPSAVAALMARHEGMVWAGIAGTLLLATWAVARTQPTPNWAILGGYLLVGLIGAREPVRHLLTGLRRGKFLLNIDFLM